MVSPVFRDSADSGYCHRACQVEPDGALCQQLSAGCGHNLRELDDNEFARERQCSEGEVKDGSCELCMRAAWCDDELGAESDSPYRGHPITTAGQFVSHFSNLGNVQHHRAPHSTNQIDYSASAASAASLRAECKFKGGQKERFIAAARAHMAAPERHGFNWNEVSGLTIGRCNHTQPEPHLT